MSIENKMAAAKSRKKQLPAARCRLAFLIALSSCALAPRASHAQNAAPPAQSAPGDVDQAIKRLSDWQWSVRQAAQDYLMRQSPEALGMIQAALNQTTDAEATSRLRHIAAHLFLKAQTSLQGEVSLLGISLSPEAIRTGPHPEDLHASIAVMTVQPGFPAAEVLRAGDRITALDGKTFPDTLTFEDFRREIIERPPGSRVKLTLYRGKTEMTVSVTLAGVPTLPDAYIQDRLARLNIYLDRLTAIEPTPAIAVLQDDSAAPVNPLLKDEN